MRRTPAPAVRQRKARRGVVKMPSVNRDRINLASARSSAGSQQSISRRDFSLAIAFYALIVLSMIIAGNNEVVAQRTKPPLRLGVSGISGSNAFPYVTQQLGLFAKYNVDVELVIFQAGVQLTHAMISGDLPLGLIDAPLILAANLSGANLVFIAANISTFPYTIVSKNDLQTATDLRGKRIGISRYGAASDTSVRLALEHQGIKPDKEVSIVQLGGQSERFAALKAGVVDAT